MLSIFFQTYLYGFGSGGMKEITVKRRVSGVVKLLNDFKITPLGLLDNETIEKVSILTLRILPAGYVWVPEQKIVFHIKFL